MSLHFTAVLYNSEGRPCGWGRSSKRPEAVWEAHYQYSTHGYPSGGGCYAGEEIGNLKVYEEDLGGDLVLVDTVEKPVLNREVPPWREGQSR